MKHFDQRQADKLNAISLKILINKTGGGGSGWPGRPVATSQTIAAAYAASLYNRIVSGKMTNSLQTASVVLPNRYFRQEKNGVMEGGGGRAPQGKTTYKSESNSFSPQLKIYINKSRQVYFNHHSTILNFFLKHRFELITPG